ncbi:hypothetical protein AQF52_0209 [Streptomyces venezuelae]|nr:hypothetical protein AQF52_0209 [Streptomyces venezuelae]CUM43984.1 hypothetical protein BN2537_16933 [Streptomyces venezuelae]
MVRRGAIVLRLLGDWWARVGTSVPSTISTVALAKRLRGVGASLGPRWSMTRSAVDLDTPKSGARWRRVKLVCQYAATSSTRSSKDSFHGRPRPGASPPSRRSCLINLPKERGLSPANGANQDGSDAVITPATARSLTRQPSDPNQTCPGRRPTQEGH